jgi:CRISPR system Cascade subunit CasA
MARSFNLVDQPFIPCILPDGGREESSLRDVLMEAHTIREIRDGSPLVTISLHRLLLAVLHRIFGPENLDAWAAIWSAGRFAPSALEAYLRGHHARFDLCDEKNPFYQVAGLAECEEVSVTRLAFVQGNNATLFDHRTEADPAALVPAETARLLIAYQTFAVGGGVSKPFNLYHAPALGQGGYLVLALGENVFQTLCLNLLCYGPRQPIPRTSYDQPAWERDKAREPDKNGTPPDGWLDYLTWQSRRIHLIPDGVEDLRFSRMQMLQGLKIAPGSGPTEPMAAYVQDKTGQWRARPFEEGRGLWRDSTALFQEITGTQKPPEAVRQLTKLRNRGLFPQQSIFRLTACGIRTDQAKISFWRHETMPLPLAILGDEKVLDSLHDAIAAAEAAVTAVSSAVWTLARGQRGFGKDRLNENQRKELRAAVDALAPDIRYWARMEEPFRQFLLELPGDQKHQSDRLSKWKQDACNIARDVFSQIVNGLDASPRTLRAVYTDDWGAQKVLNVELAKITSTINQP